MPAAFRPLWRGQTAVLRTHRGYDIGALPLARRLARARQAPLIAATVTRLLVDLNRSEHHRRLFSEFTETLSKAQRAAILARYYHPHRSRVEALVREAGGPVVHIGVHSFTPVLNGDVRHTDIGLLYDPARPGERAFCRAFKAAFTELGTPWRLRFNYPYRGAADGFTTHLRRRFGATRYVGVELEVNQGLMALGAAWSELSRALLETFVAMA